MQSKKIKPSGSSKIARRDRGAHPSSQSKTKSIRHAAFFPLLLLLLFMWVVYRSQLSFPVWFDETVGKAVFFGLPVALYISLTQATVIKETFGISKIYPGLLLGVAVGGLFGFAASITTLVSRGAVVQAAPLFLSDAFWWQFFLAMMTGFWETLFFYTWVMTVIIEKFWRWPMVNQLAMVMGIFLAFHLPNIFLRFSAPQVIVSQILLLALFALGQALFFWRTRNFYALVICQAIWGMVLMVSTR
jgi:hypothetical protein